MEHLKENPQIIFHRELLKKALTGLFGTLDDMQFSSIERYFQWIQLPGGETLLKEGDAGDSSYILITGRLRAYIQGWPHHKIIGEISEGETVGEMSLITGAPRSASIYAIRDSVLVKLPKEDFEKIVLSFPTTMMKITQLLINRLVIQNQGKRPIARIDNIAILNLSRVVNINLFATDLRRELTRFGTTANLDAQAVDEQIGIKEIANSTQEDAEKYHRLSSWLDYQEQSYDYLVYVANVEQPEWTKRCLRQADYVFIIVDDYRDQHNINIWKHQFSDITKANKCLIICSDKESLPTHTERIRDVYGIKEHLHLNVSKQEDLARLSRKIVGKSIGLVLSGGGARGMAHLGVYQALLERNFPIDMCGGTSIGSLMSALIAMRMPLDEMINLVRDEFKRNPTSDYYLVPLISIIKGNKLERALKRCFEDQLIEDLWIPYFCVSSNLSKSQAEHHTEGLLRQAIRASISIPGVLPPVVQKSGVYVDGGIFNNFPVDFMQEFGAGTILAVDLDSNNKLSLNENVKPSNWSYVKTRWIKKNYEENEKIPGLINTITRATIASSHDRANRNLNLVNILFTPATQKYGIMDWKAFDKILEEGYRHANTILDSVQLKDFI